MKILKRLWGEFLLALLILVAVGLGIGAGTFVSWLFHLTSTPSVVVTLLLVALFWYFGDEFANDLRRDFTA